MDAMQEYTAEVEEAIPQIVDNTADALVQEISSTAPRRSGTYMKSRIGLNPQDFSKVIRAEAINVSYERK
jgi:hypothetical protein